MARNENPRSGRGWKTLFAAGHGTADPITAPPGAQRDRTRALLVRLRGSYPVLSEYQPLSIGIRAGLHAALPDVVHKTIARALAMHCRSDRYLRALAAGGPRYGLDGTPSGEVSQDHRAAAARVLARRAEKHVEADPPRTMGNEGPARPTLRLRKLRKPGGAA